MSARRDPEGVGAPRDYIEKTGVDRVIVWNIYEVTGNKIAVATLAGQRTDPQRARFIEWFRSQPQ